MTAFRVRCLQGPKIGSADKEDTMNATPTPESFEAGPLAGVTVTLSLGADGYPVVQIDTDVDLTPSDDGGAPLLRVHVNDCCVENTTPLHNGQTGW